MKRKSSYYIQKMKMELGMVAHNLTTLQVGSSNIQDQPPLYNELEATLSYKNFFIYFLHSGLLWAQS